MPLCGNSRIHQVDVKSYVLRVLHTELGDSKYRPSPLLIKYVDAGWLGNLYLLVYIRGKEREREILPWKIVCSDFTRKKEWPWVLCVFSKVMHV